VLQKPPRLGTEVDLLLLLRHRKVARVLEKDIGCFNTIYLGYILQQNALPSMTRATITK
jgi:hypothetical protein